MQRQACEALAAIHCPGLKVREYGKDWGVSGREDDRADYERLRIVRYTSQNFDLERMRALLKRMGNPHDQFRTVHVAGTKGKGSTCAMIASMLQACGYTVGLYTSPHLVDLRERRLQRRPAEERREALDRLGAFLRI
jgi:hypothetical protein